MRTVDRGDRRCAAAQPQLVLDPREFAGAFVDRRELSRCCGTAVALLRLDVLDRAGR